MTCPCPRSLSLASALLLACSLLAAADGLATDALAFYNAATVSADDLLAGCDPDARVELNELALNGWGFRALVREPSARPGVLAAFEDAAPLGFSRSDVEAAVVLALHQLPPGEAELSGVLAPVGLKFRHPLQPDAAGPLRIPVPAACLAPGDYTLTVRLRAGAVTEWAELPLVIGPYLRRDRFHTYAWNSGGRTEADLAGQMELARLGGMDVLDTPYLPAVTALREGFLVSAHYVTIYQGDVAEGHAATDPYIDMARVQAEAIGDMARRYRHLLWCLPNSEYGSDRLVRTASYERALQEETGLSFDALRLASDRPLIPDRALPQVSPGVYAHHLPEIAAHRFARRHGTGWFELNRQSMAAIRERAPWLTLWTDPVVTNEQFEGFDAVSFWHYGIDPHMTVARTQRAECARRLSGAGQVFLTLSQWYSGIAGAEDGWALRGPDQHRFESWLALTLPVHALGYWAIGELAENPDCAAGLRAALGDVVYPYGTLLQGSTLPPAPVALYVSTTGEFLGRAHRAHNFWAHHHYLNGVLPALFQRFGSQVDWLDDDDVLAGRLSSYPVALCPMLEATTDELLAKLREYQEGGGLLAGDEYWAVEELAPALQFPGKSTDTLGIPYANENLAQWHRLNREAILQWQPPEIPPPAELLAITASTPDVFAAVRDAGDVRFAVIANGRFRKGEFAERHGYTDERYLDQGVAQETEVLVQAPAAAVVYDVTHSRRLEESACPSVGGRRRLRVELDAAGGAIFAFHPRPIAAIRADLGLPGAAMPGAIVPLTLTVVDDRDRPIPGPTALQVSVRDATGGEHDVSGFYPAGAGVARVPFGIPLEAEPGAWVIEARDLTSGQSLRLNLAVVARPEP